MREEGGVSKIVPSGGIIHQVVLHHGVVNNRYYHVVSLEGEYASIEEGAQDVSAQDRHSVGPFYCNSVVTYITRGGQGDNAQFHDGKLCDRCGKL